MRGLLEGLCSGTGILAAAFFDVHGALRASAGDPDWIALLVAAAQEDDAHSVRLDIVVRHIPGGTLAVAVDAPENLLAARFHASVAASRLRIRTSSSEIPIASAVARRRSAG